MFCGGFLADGVPIDYNCLSLNATIVVRLLNGDQRYCMCFVPVIQAILRVWSIIDKAKV